MGSVRGAFTSIVTWEWVTLLLLLPVALFPDGPQAILLLLIPFFWLLHFISGERLFPRSPYNLSLALIGVMLLISLTVTFDFTLSLTKITGILYGIALLMASTRLIRAERFGIWWVVSVVLVAGTVMALIGLVGVTWLEPFGFLNTFKTTLPPTLQSVPGAVGGVINENELAGTLAWIAPLFIGCLIGLPRSISKRGLLVGVLLAVGTGLLCGVIIATQSRGGVLALLLSTALVISLFVPRHWRLVVLAVAIVISMVWYFSYGNALDTAAPGIKALQLSSRLEIWSRAIMAISDFPLTGIGVNGFRRVIQVLYPTFLVGPDIDLGHAHNHMLQTALDIGLPGLIGYLSLWLLSAGMIVRNLQRLTHLRAEQHSIYALTVGLLGSLVAGWLFGLLDAISLGARPGFVWWLLIALCGGVHFLVMYQSETLGRRRRRHAANEKPALPKPMHDPVRAPVISTPLAPGPSYPEARPSSRPRMRYRPPRDS